LGKFWSDLQRKILVYFMAICFFCGNLVHFYPFWYIVPRKIWQPWSVENFPRSERHPRVRSPVNRIKNFVSRSKNFDVDSPTYSILYRGLPDSIFSNKKSQFGKILEGVAVEDVGIFFAIRYIPIPRRQCMCVNSCVT
jgi:hypothetical protein